GLPREAAHYAAQRAFGNVTLVKEDVRALWAGTTLETLARDLRFAGRQFRKNPGFTAVAVLSLALGIGANTAIFSILHALVLRRLPVYDPQRLVVVATPFPARDSVRYGLSFTYPFFRDLQDESQTLSGILAFRTSPWSLSTGGVTERITGAT